MRDGFNIAAYGSFFSPNYGDRLIFETMQEVFKNKFNCNLCKFPIMPDYNFNLRKIRLWNLIKIITYIIPKHYLRMYLLGRKMDANLIGGGNLIKEYSQFSGILFFLTCITLWSTGKPLFTFAIGAEVIKSSFAKKLLKLSLHFTKTNIVRDVHTKKVLFESGIKNIVLAADPVFCRNDEQIESKENLIGITVPPYFHPDIDKIFNDENQYYKYLNALKEMVNEIKNHFPLYDIIIIPSNIEDDTFMAKDLMRAVGFDLDIGNIKTTQDLIKIISRCKLIIGARMHPLIIGITQNIPVLALPINPKTKSLFQDLIKKSEWLISFDDIHDKEIIKKINYCLSNQDEIRKELSKIKKNISRLAFTSFTIIYNEILNNNK